MLCGDGSVAKIIVDESGKERARGMMKNVFDREREFLAEKAVRHGKRWIFVTNTGEIRIVDFSGDDPEIAARWPLFNDAERKDGWWIGGQQHLAVHAADGLLYALVHQGGPDSHKDPGKDVFVYSIESGERVRRLTLERDASSIEVTQGKDSYVLTTNAYPPTLDVYDATSGELIRSMTDVAVTPMLLQLPQRAGVAQ